MREPEVIALVLRDRNEAGRWAEGSHTADTVYDRRHGAGTRDPLVAVPLYGGPAHAAVADARPGTGAEGDAG
ncbi:hypothetical protein [Streptomyces galbus]|uniref:Uncharacterized protein n=1 Tax=Streptomyces galbus TaxID=33898 RepID=A0A4U5WWJ0_STRGB|nr:hypothetical protein [Streptomyces galbus]TKT06640.1 hypothetical protein E4U92_26725 [Streptomyces galbus]